jgi:hypothetical protein
MHHRTAGGKGSAMAGRYFASLSKSSETEFMQ